MNGTSNSFQWKRHDGWDLEWGREHTKEGDCPGCCCNGPVECPNCGGRLHSEPVEASTTDGWGVVDSYFCQEEAIDDMDEPVEFRYI